MSAAPLLAVKSLDLGVHKIRQGAKLELGDFPREGVIGPLLAPADHMHGKGPGKTGKRLA